MKEQSSQLKTFVFSFVMLLSIAFMPTNAKAQYLDNLTDAWSKAPTAAYSTRKVMSGYSGPAMRLRRSSDNQMVDVYFDTNGWVSYSSTVSGAVAYTDAATVAGSTTLGTWVGSNSAYVVKWYDQSGNNNHATPVECTGTLNAVTNSTSITGTGTQFTYIQNTGGPELAAGTKLYDITTGNLLVTVGSSAPSSSTTFTAASPVTLNAGTKFFTYESQPRFVNGGTIDAMPNGKPALYLSEVQNTASTSGLNTPLVLSADANVNLFAMTRRTQANSNNPVAIVLGNWTNSNSASANNFSAGFSLANQMCLRASIFPTLSTTNASITNVPYAIRYYANAKKTTTANENAGVTQMDGAGATTTSSATGAIAFTNTSYLHLFRPVTFSARSFMGYCPEVIYYANTTTDAVFSETDASTWQTSQKTAYMDMPPVPATQTILVGASQTYKTIQSAYDAGISSTITSPYIIELQSDYDPTAETYPIVLGAKAGSFSWLTTTIRPAAGVSKTFTGSAASIFKFYGAKYVTIDGQSGGTGGAQNLTIENTNTAATASTIAMVNNAIGNRVLYCKVLGAAVSTTAAPTSGTIAIGSAAEAITGYGFNTISNCDIADASTGLPTVGVYLAGASGFNNEGNTISNCNIYNFFNPGAFTSSGIYNDMYAQSTVITGNKLYQTGTRTFTGDGLAYPIYINTSGTIASVSNNVIGYSSSAATGRMTYTAGTGVSPRFAGIFINNYLQSNAPTMNGNTISAIDFTSASVGNGAQGVVVGIYQQAGNIVYATSANTISNINLYFSASTTATFGLGGYSYNYISGSSNFGLTNVYGLSAIPVGTDATIIGKVIGIYCTQAYTAAAKLNNVCNLSCGTAGSTGAHVVQGINLNTSANTAITAERNLVYNLNAISTGASVITGVACWSGTAVSTYKNNMIRLGVDVANGPEIRGIYKNSTGKDVVYHNTVYIGGTASGTTANTSAFYRNTTTPTAAGEAIKNNIFVNKRTGGTTGIHYAMKFLNAADQTGGFIACTYNSYLINAADATNKLGSVASTDYPTITEWNTLTNFNTGNVSADPMFVDPTNATTPDLRIVGNATVVSGKGVDLHTVVTDDFFGTSRASITTPALGAYEYTADVVAPTVVITSVTEPTTASNPIPVTITFSEAVTGFTLSDLTVGNGTAGNLQGSGAVYTVDITPASSQCTVTVDIAAGVATDLATNGNTAATQFSRNYDFNTKIATNNSELSSVYASNNSIVISRSIGQRATIYSVAGQILKSFVINDTIATVPMEKGYYIVSIGNRQTKVIVK